MDIKEYEDIGTLRWFGAWLVQKNQTLPTATISPKERVYLGPVFDSLLRCSFTNPLR